MAMVGAPWLQRTIASDRVLGILQVRLSRLWCLLAPQAQAIEQGQAAAEDSLPVSIICFSKLRLQYPMEVVPPFPVVTKLDRCLDIQMFKF